MKVGNLVIHILDKESFGIVIEGRTEQSHLELSIRDYKIYWLDEEIYKWESRCALKICHVLDNSGNDA